MQFFPVAYGVFTIIGGIIGYVKAGSLDSLIAGVVSGAVILAGSMAWLKGKQWGFYALVVMSLILGGWFLNGFLQHGKIMPAGVMVILSILNLVILFLQRGKLTKIS